ncbi:DNA adenine methylase [Clostridium perfringens]|nr:DNA adenine methylase [Clostridium perfringens]
MITIKLNKLNLIKSPLNYIGGKYKILPQLLEIFPQKISTLYDVFGGGANVSVNTNAEHVYYNDIVNHVVDIFKNLNNAKKNDIIEEIEYIIKKYNLNKDNEEGFKKCREDYNNGNKKWSMFYTLMCFSFNNQFRFNNKKEYNSSFGKHKSCFSNVTRNKLVNFIDRLNNIDIEFNNLDFREVNFSNADKNDLIYFDPPYLITTGNYNDGKRGFKGWGQQDDIDLMNLCDRLNQQGTRFAMSNVFENKGNVNTKLIEWAKKYNVHYLNNSYNNSNYQSKDKGKNTTVEVVITNY